MGGGRKTLSTYCLYTACSKDERSHRAYNATRLIWTDDKRMLQVYYQITQVYYSASTTVHTNTSKIRGRVLIKVHIDTVRLITKGEAYHPCCNTTVAAPQKRPSSYIRVPGVCRLSARHLRTIGIETHSTQGQQNMH